MYANNYWIKSKEKINNNENNLQIAVETEFSDMCVKLESLVNRIASLAGQSSNEKWTVSSRCLIEKKQWCT